MFWSTPTTSVSLSCSCAMNESFGMCAGSGSGSIGRRLVVTVAVLHGGVAEAATARRTTTTAPGTPGR